MKCPYCNAENSDGYAFCDLCGKPLKPIIKPKKRQETKFHKEIIGESKKEVIEKNKNFSWTKVVKICAFIMIIALTVGGGFLGAIIGDEIGDELLMLVGAIAGGIFGLVCGMIVVSINM
ncbi:MAG: zinc-ribbon domain-containing protein [Acutalibacteraceae bacterium]